MVKFFFYKISRGENSNLNNSPLFKNTSFMFLFDACTLKYVQHVVERKATNLLNSSRLQPLKVCLIEGLINNANRLTFIHSTNGMIDV